MKRQRLSLLRRRRLRGYSLVEILVYLGIVAILMTGAVLVAGRLFRTARVTTAENSLVAIQLATSAYLAEYKRYPASMREIVDAGYFKDDLKDPWGRPYVWSPPSAESEEPRIHSTGPDGVDGSDDDVYAPGERRKSN